MSFSPEVRKEIRQRDQGPLGSLSYDFGENEDGRDTNQCSHDNHSRHEDFYNSAENGRLVNPPTHWLEHKFQVDRLGNMDLDEETFNRNSAAGVYGNLTKDMKAYLEWVALMQ